MVDHPGSFLQKVLSDHNLSGCEFAGLIDVPSNRINDIIRGRRRITADTALRIARYFNTSAPLWMKVQSDYDLKLAEAEIGKIIKQTIKPRR